MYAFTRPIRDGRNGKTVPASRFIGPNVGRWDYTASMYRTSRADLSGIPPDTNVVTMYDFLYRYREPNRRIEPEEAIACIEESSACRTAD